MHTFGAGLRYVAALDPLEEHPVTLHETRLEAPMGRPATHEHDVGGRERRVLEVVEDVVLHPGLEEELRELIDMFDAPGPPRPVEEVDVVTATRGSAFANSYIAMMPPVRSLELGKTKLRIKWVSAPARPAQSLRSRDRPPNHSSGRSP